MKKTLLNQWLKSACIAVLGFVSVSASAEDEPDATFDFKGTISTSAPLTVGEVTATVSQTTAYGNGANIYRTDSGYDWMLALESERNIVRIEYTVTGGAYNLTTLDVGVFGAQSSTEGVWTGSAKKVELHADYTSYFDEYVTDAKVWLEAVDNSEEIAGTPVMVTLPYSATFDAAEDRAKVAAIDANADGQTFRFDQEESNYFAVLNTQNISYQANDYLVLCKASLVANKPYTLSIDGQSPSGGWHYYEIVAGTEPTMESMTTMLTYAWQNVFETTWTTKTQNEFKVETSGDYYIALRCYSYAGYGKVYFDNFTLDAVPAAMPAKATNLTAVAGENGALSATIGFTMPTATYGEDEYVSGKSLTYTVKNDNVIVETGTAAAGAQVSVTDNNPTNGTNYYSVVISDGSNGDSEAAQVSVYVGIDKPYAPTNVQMSVDGNSITLTWEAPTEGYNRGYLGTITYNVYPYRNYTMGDAINQTAITETTYTFEYDLSVGDQCDMKFCVVAVTAGGSSYAAYTATSVSAGAPYELPFYEDFLGDADHYTIQASTGSGSGADWGEEIYMGSYSGDAAVDFTTGKISLNHSKASASVSCRVDDENTASFEILVVDNTGTEYVIETIDTPSIYYQTYTCLLDGDYVDADWIRFIVRAHFTEAYQYAYINNVSIEVASTDITVSEAGYTTYYNSAKGYIMPEGLTGYLISSNDLKLEVAYEAGSNVPAGEPLVLQGNAGKYELLLTNNNGYTKVDFAENILAGTDTEMTTPLSFYATYVGASADNCYFFGLSLNASGDLESVGFYFMNETGSAFTNGANKAYLCVPKNMLDGADANAIHGFRFDELEEGLSTAIGQVNATDDAARYYNLSGMRVNSDAKGLIIRDGKKMFNK